jgi:SAM-dependent methyltransferase
VYDNSPRQLAQDRLVAEREGLTLATIEGDMRRLDGLADENFDLIVHPVSNTYVPEVRPVWKEAYRVLRPGGRLLAGFGNPAVYLFDWEAAERGELMVRHTLPYSDLDSLTDTERQGLIDKGQALEWSHSLTEQIGGQLEGGAGDHRFLRRLHDRTAHWAVLAGATFATRAVKPAGNSGV